MNLIYAILFIVALLVNGFWGISLVCRSTRYCAIRRNPDWFHSDPNRLAIFRYQTVFVWLGRLIAIAAVTGMLLALDDDRPRGAMAGALILGMIATGLLSLVETLVSSRIQRSVPRADRRSADLEPKEYADILPTWTVALPWVVVVLVYAACIMAAARGEIDRPLGVASLGLGLGIAALTYWSSWLSLFGRRRVRQSSGWESRWAAWTLMITAWWVGAVCVWIGAVLLFGFDGIRRSHFALGVSLLMLLLYATPFLSAKGREFVRDVSASPFGTGSSRTTAN